MKNNEYDPTKVLGRGGGAPQETTRLLGREKKAAHPSAGEATRIIEDERDDSGGKTVLIRPGRTSPSSSPPPGGTPPADYEHTRKTSRQEDPGATVLLGRETSSQSHPARMAGPVCGWLAVVAGPGEGGFVPLGYGMNTLGRDPDQRCRLDFGDSKISRKSHASLTYDAKNRKFYITHGGGQNLTYISSEPVLIPVELKGGEFIEMGDTVLRFVPLCGPDFEYGEHTKQAKE